MKLPDVYRDWRIVFGLALVLLGAGNWIVGRERTEQYSKIIAAQSDTAADQAYRSFDELDSNAVVEPFNSEQRRVSYATARMDFYHATFRTGQALVVIGLVLTFLGFLSIIQRDARHAMRRINPKPDAMETPDC
jgi:hypothetical protein